MRKLFLGVLFCITATLSFTNTAYAESCYIKGDGYDENVARCTELAEQGDADAQFWLGYFYYKGKLIGKDREKAANWYRKSAEQGYAKSQYHLGKAYLKGRGVPRDNTEAAKWFTKASNQGHREAQFQLGNIYAAGKGVTQNYNNAAHWYEQAARQGHDKAESKLAALRREGKLSQQLATPEAVQTPAPATIASKTAPAIQQTPRKSSARRDSQLAQQRQTQRSEQRRLEAEAERKRQAQLAELKQLEEQAERKRQELARLQQQERKADQRRQAELAKQREAEQQASKLKGLIAKAETGDTLSQSILADKYDKGVEVTKDQFEATRWYLAAAEQGELLAQHAVAKRYEEGKGVTQDYEQAAYWYSKAADNYTSDSSNDFIREDALDNLNRLYDYGYVSSWESYLPYIVAGLIILLLGFFMMKKLKPSPREVGIAATPSAKSAPSTTKPAPSTTSQTASMQRREPVLKTAEPSTTEVKEKQEKQENKGKIGIGHIALIILTSCIFGAIGGGIGMVMLELDEFAPAAIVATIVMVPIMYLLYSWYYRCKKCGTKWARESSHTEDIDHYTITKKEDVHEGGIKYKRDVQYLVRLYWQYFICKECGDVTREKKKQESRV